MGPLDASRPWATRDVVGQYRFLQRLWRNMVDEETGECVVVETPANDETRRLLHKTIDTVRTEMDALRFNTAIAKLIELNNHITKLGEMPREVCRADGRDACPAGSPRCRGTLEQTRPGPTRPAGRSPTSIFRSRTPSCSSTTPIEVPIQVNGKVRSRVSVTADASKDELEAAALADDKVVAALDGGSPVKVIVGSRPHGQRRRLTTDTSTSPRPPLTFHR